MTRKLVVLGTIVVIFTIAISLAMYLMSLKPEQKKKPPVETTIYVKAEKVHYTQIESKVVATGRVNSVRQVDLSVEVQGKILESPIPLKKGQQFKKGNLLVSIYKLDASYNLSSQKSRFLNLIANILPDLKIDYSDNYNAWETFFNQISIDKNLPKLPSLKSTQEKIFIASKNVLSEYYNIKSGEIRLGKYNIYAPFSGSYTDVFLEAGSVANPGARIAKMIRTDLLEVEVPVEVNDVKWINIGDIVNFKNESDIWEGKVIRKSKNVDLQTQSINIYAEIKDFKKAELFQGEYLKATFPGKIFDNAMEMPRKALLNDNMVFTIVGERLIKGKITVLKLNEKTLLFSGLKENEELVVEPLLNIAENTKVSILRETKN